MFWTALPPFLWIPFETGFGLRLVIDYLRSGKFSDLEWLLLHNSEHLLTDEFDLVDLIHDFVLSLFSVQRHSLGA